MRRLSVSDASFLLAEKRETPMHVGGLHLYTFPDDVDEQAFLGDLVSILRDEEPLRSPYDSVLKTGPLGLLGPCHWEPDQQLDMEYHVRHSALPRPGRYRELFALTSRLHGTLLDRDRPLWELHVIEGLQNRQFATYNKIHHSVTDGIAAIHLAQSMLSPDPNAWINYSCFTERARQAYKRKLKAMEKVAPPEETFSYRDIAQVADMLRQQWDAGKTLLKTTSKVVSVFAGRGGALDMPWHAIPRTALNSPVTGARRFVAQSWSMERVKAVCKAFDGTLNDTVLAMCSGALRRYLTVESRLPDKPLKAMTPVSLRRPGDLESANAVAFITANLATHIDDPAERYAAITASSTAGKRLIRQLSPSQAVLFTAVMQAPAAITTLAGLAPRYPAFNTVISNVPGPREPQYWNGARLDGMYPASIPFDGFALNITLVSYAGSLDFGITTCRRTLPRVQRLIDYLEMALVELEEAAGIAPPTRRPSRSKKTQVAPVKQTPAKALATAEAKAASKVTTKVTTKVTKKAKQTVKPATKTKAGTGAKTKSKARVKAKATPKSVPRGKRVAAKARPKLVSG